MTLSSACAEGRQVSEEENAFEAHYSEDGSNNPLPPFSKGDVNISVEDFPLDDDSDIPVTVTPKPDGFNPVIHDCASEITEAFGDCWVEVKALKPNGSYPDYMIAIQPDGYTPNDIQLKLRSLGYAPAFKKIHNYPNSTPWVYFDVSYNGIAFELRSTVDSIEPPEIDRYDEPATDDELPF